jgi:hypothetical protein
MRFSLKWLLVGTAYAAVAAAAFGTGIWYYADALWAISFLAVVYAATLAILIRGRAQFAAVAFTLASVFYVVQVAYASDSVPTTRLLEALGFGPQATISWQTYPPTPSATRIQTPVAGRRLYSTLGSPSSLYQGLFAVFDTYVRAANAVATLAFGLMGSLVGLLAYRAARREGN